MPHGVTSSGVVASGVIASIVAPHTPRIGIEANAPEFARGLIEGLREVGEAVRALKPDLIVLLSAHWVSTFNWYVTTHARHEGICIADEAPDLIPGVPYSRPGHPEFAEQLAQKLIAAGVPCGRNDSPHFSWDYASYVPLLYMDPASEIPVVLMPTVICSEQDEARQVGRLVHELASEQGQRVAFISSCALSHKVVRGPEKWPTDARLALDHRFMELVETSNLAELAAWAPTFCREGVAEMDGRTINGMIGAAQAMAEGGAALTGRRFGSYGQSSGSGNATLAFLAQG